MNTVRHAPADASAMLTVNNLSAAYSGIKALRGASLTVHEGEFVALIGPNGAGKSTLLNCLSGVVRPTAGSIRFMGQELVGVAPWNVARKGLLQVPEGRQVLPNLSVRENLTLGATALSGRASTYSLERIHTLFPILAERREQRAGSLSGGQQQMLAIGRALMGAPRLLLLDEPCAGLSTAETQQQIEVIVQAVSRLGSTALVIEHDMAAVQRLSNEVFVLHQGQLLANGTLKQMQDSPLVQAVYAGGQK